MPTIYITIGCPASGKSTWRRAQLPDATLISPDAVLEEKWDYEWSPARAASAWNTCYQALGRHILTEAYSADAHTAEYVWDAMNLVPRDRTAVLNICKGLGWRVIAVYFDTPIEVCIARNAARPRKRCLPDKRMGEAWARLTPPQETEAFDDVIVVGPGDL